MPITILGALPTDHPKILEKGAELVLEKTFPANQRWDECEVEHLHDHQDEYVEILEGMLSARTAGEERTYVSAERFKISKGVPHQVCNLSSKPVRTLWMVSPAMDTAAFIEAVQILRVDGKTDCLLQQAVVAWKFRDVFKPLGPPRWVHPLSIATLALIGRLLGYKAQPIGKAEDFKDNDGRIND